MTDYPDFDTDAVNKTFYEWEHHKEENIMGFPRQRLPVDHDREHVARAPHTVDGGHGRLAGELFADRD